MVGLFKRFTPKFVKVYAYVYTTQLKAVEDFIQDIRSASFPGNEHSFGMAADTVEQLRRQLGS
jgi:3-methyl-2-oxobutanoate hydroxymethyltransferase